MLCRLSFLWKQRALVVLKSSSLLHWRILQGSSEYRTPALAAATPSLPVAHLAGEENLLLHLLLKLRRGVVRKKKTLSEINVAAQRAFTIALWSIYIENTIKLSQGEKRKPHVHSVWSPRSPGTSIACLFSSALLWHQIVKKGREHDAISINTWTSGLLKKQKKSSAKKSFSRATAFLKLEFNI